LSAFAAIVALVLSVHAAPHGGDCDNLAGECLRQRQRLAITGVEALCLISLIVGAACLVMVIRGARLRRNVLGALALCGALVAIVMFVQPVDHLNNRVGDWLSATR
jgi:hypothetical protein